LSSLTNNHMNRIIILATCLLMAFSVSGQTKKDKAKKKANVKTVTEWETTYDDGKPTTLKTSREEYDRNGRMTLQIDYGSDGSVLRKETTAFDSYGDKTEVTVFDAVKKKSTKTAYKYNAFRDKTEEDEYNSAGTLVKKTEFSYNAEGKKAKETVTDASGAVLKKIVYSYNAKSLKTGKQTLNNANAVESEKKWEYEYY
jgi:hypothetical protein